MKSLVLILAFCSIVAAADTVIVSMRIVPPDSTTIEIVKRLICHDDAGDCGKDSLSTWCDTWEWRNNKIKFKSKKNPVYYKKRHVVQDSIEWGATLDHK